MSLSRRSAGSGSELRFPSAHFSPWRIRWAIDLSLIRQVVRNGAVNLFEAKKLEILADSLGRLASPERMDDRIQGDSGARDVVVSVPRFDVFLGHACFDCTLYSRTILAS
jgi:hypothetical protein